MLHLKEFLPQNAKLVVLSAVIESPEQRLVLESLKVESKKSKS